jgi:pyruvate/2-oxoglutarate/acetoin dehydrogenase E1 component/TPP-dependent pyruvate/acetoin dehydrogenase alpha subunit
MGSSFSTHSLDEKYEWKDLTKQFNSSADLSPTGSQMPRLLGLAQASKIYKNVKISSSEKFSDNGNEIAWGTIGDASTSEGHFFESINAAGVMQIPMIISIWDDNYGISVSSEYQTTKGDISEVLKGFQKDKNSNGFEIFKVKGWDYVELMKTYQKAEEICRKNHTPVIIHVNELTQPLGHSTSGSHERYKSKDRLKWEKEYDCIIKMREWILENKLITKTELEKIESESKDEVRKARSNAKSNSLEETIVNIKNFNNFFKENIDFKNQNISSILNSLNEIKEPSKKDLFSSVNKIYREMLLNKRQKSSLINDWLIKLKEKIQYDYSSHLYSESLYSPKNIQAVNPTYDDKHELADGRIILRDNFDKILEKNHNVVIFGEDAGLIGGVNQALEGLQEKYGKYRVFDTGIREATIIGQGIGLALRGFRPIAEIQYLDYLLYAIQIMSDDLATLHYRTRGKQKAPIIIRTRGHRLEGIWHAGSPMGGMINLLRGIYLLVPRNMTIAAGFYNTLLSSDQPAVVVECLNGYRTKEKKPNNMGDFKIPIGKIDTVKEGNDITVVSYGSTLKLVEDASKELEKLNIDCEIIDCQSLIPFDLNHEIKLSVEKTNRLLIVDEDFSAGASAYILDRLINDQNIYDLLDSKPSTLSAKDHRTAYGTDGDYFSKPSIDDIFNKIYSIMNESNPEKFSY